MQGCDLLVQVVVVNYFVIFIVGAFFNDGSCLIHVVELTTGITIIAFTDAMPESFLEPAAYL